MNKYRLSVGLPEPQTHEEINAQSTIEGMRAAIHDGRRDSAIIRNCLMISAHRGLNGEDTATLLAYHALVALEKASIHISELLKLQKF